MLRFFFAVLLLLVPSLAAAQVKLDGTFVAARECPALTSIKKNKNPGNVSVTVGQSYQVVGKNKNDASHYFIRTEQGNRWVSVDCGSIGGAPKQGEASSNKAPFFVLAISWQPAFCESKPDKTECKAQTSKSYEAGNFTLHGLWPQPRSNVFCNVPKAQVAADNARQWDDLPAVQLKPETRRALDEVMPGTQSNLDRHEWIKHGTCFPGGDMEAYYSQSVRLMRAINGSAMREVVAVNVGKSVQARDLRTAFDKTFGAGAGDRIRISCSRDGNRSLISELTIGLKGEIRDGVALKDLIMASTPTDPGCPEGVIDPVGLQ
jgi:ribonuclease T2